MRVLAIDPGRDKCGIAVLDETGKIYFQQVIKTSELQDVIGSLIKSFDVKKIILGDGTTSKDVKKMIETNMNAEVTIVDEKHTTEEARKLYWKKFPPKGWRKFLPTSMQVPPVPVDDLVAEILAKRFLKINFDDYGA